MFDWLADLLIGFGEAVGSLIEGIGEQLTGVIWDALVLWIYNSVYDSVAEFFQKMGNIGKDLSWDKSGRCFL